MPRLSDDSGPSRHRGRSAQGVLDRGRGRRSRCSRWPPSASRSAATATGSCAASPAAGRTPTWAIEGAAGLGAPLTARLRADGIEVIDVPAKLAARVRLLSTGHGRKNDEADALSVGIAALTAHRLHTAAIDEAIAALRALTEHRDDLVRTRTQTVNRLHALLAQLIPAGLPARPDRRHRRRLAAPRPAPRHRRPAPCAGSPSTCQRGPPAGPAHRRGRHRRSRPRSPRPAPP